MKMTMMNPGWSAVGGQTLSPYVGQIEKGETLLGQSVCFNAKPPRNAEKVIGPWRLKI